MRSSFTPVCRPASLSLHGIPPRSQPGLRACPWPSTPLRGPLPVQVLVDTPLAPYFSENLTSEDLDEMNIEVGGRWVRAPPARCWGAWAWRTVHRGRPRHHAALV